MDRAALSDDIEKAVSLSGSKELSDNITIEKEKKGSSYS